MNKTKKVFATLICVAMFLSIMAMSVSALVIYDNSGNRVGTSVLTSSNNSRIYYLTVTDDDGLGAYGRIYLYDSNGSLIDGGWNSGSSVSLTKGNANIAPAYRSIWASVDGYRYTYYDEY